MRRPSVTRSPGCTAIVARLVEWDVTLRDISAGLIDFPALANGRPVWLCWRLGEGDIAWWHNTDEGFSARKPLERPARRRRRLDLLIEPPEARV